MSDPHSFQEKLSLGEEWEVKIKPAIENQIQSFSAERIQFDEEPEKQLSGIDQTLTQDSFNIDVKVRDNRYCCDDVFIETVSVEERNSDGWLYSDGTDIVAYCWLNRLGDNLCDGVLLETSNPFVEWFEGNKTKFKEKRLQSVDEETGRKWHTIGSIVPIGSIPKGFIITDFDPELPTGLITDQDKLDNWADD